MNRSKVVQTLYELGIPCHLKGYNYLTDCIILFDENKSLKNTYCIMAKMHNTNISNIERLIRYTIEIAFDKGNYLKLNAYFEYVIPYYKNKPTNKEFITTILSKIEKDNYMEG